MKKQPKAVPPKLVGRSLAAELEQAAASPRKPKKATYSRRDMRATH